jgi:CARDB
MTRFSFKWFVAFVALSLLSVAAFAQTAGPSAQISLGVTPTVASAGSTVTVFGSITNTSSKSEKVTINYDVVGPCNYTETYTLKVTLKPGETRTLSTTETAPACPGDYTITATAISGGTVLDVKSTTVTVQ